ncbi:YdcH family protein [Pseudomonas frederiksbergensis]|uniref:YdcH family protein n=1 Tax=Pseudomonas frederiksbergensis TaxID=104087 RepID=UPI003D1B1983
MPVTHDLYQDLRCTKEEIQQKRTTDPLLDSLLNKYSQADAEVLKAESAQSDAPSDDALKKLKEKRLQVKDKIVQQLQARS